MEDELLLDWREGGHDFFHFCPFRKYDNYGKVSRVSFFEKRAIWKWPGLEFHHASVKASAAK